MKKSELKSTPLNLDGKSKETKFRYTHCSFYNTNLYLDDLKLSFTPETLVEKRGYTNSLFPRSPLRLNIAEYGKRSPIAKALPWHILS